MSGIRRIVRCRGEIGCGLGLPTGAGGGDFYWLGTTSNDPANAANWSHSDGGTGGAGLPSASSAVHFTGNGNHDCTLSAAVAWGSIDMESGYTSTFTVGGHDVTLAGDWTVAAGPAFGSMGSTAIAVKGSLDWQGSDGSLLNAKNATADWTLTVTGSADMSFCDIQHCDASGGSEVDARAACTDSGDNTSVNFGSAVVTRGGDYVTTRDADYVTLTT